MIPAKFSKQNVLHDDLIEEIGLTYNERLIADRSSDKNMKDTDGALNSLHENETNRTAGRLAGL